jgi:hypothetical protein
MSGRAAGLAWGATIQFNRAVETDVDAQSAVGFVTTQWSVAVLRGANNCSAWDWSKPTIWESAV